MVFDAKAIVDKTMNKKSKEKRKEHIISAHKHSM